ncbi:MAG: ribosomal L7Ae/L30e/S12e/Gadd45 family protein, partial [Oscillospiraceae bacterium]|nr:ribosomal L7Ae/L30e/S12e/Gadd45 family protein [Oscillospiraceae bacterium]
MERLSGSEKVVGLKQVRRAVTEGRVNLVFLACDADPRLTESLEELCNEHGVATVWDYTMAQLGKACGIAVGTA